MSDQEEYWKEYIDIERSTPGRYVLNGKDRMYCVTGRSQGSLKKSELRSRIKEDRIQELPRRFQDLFDDMALIKYSDVEFLSESEKHELWEEILDIDAHTQTRLNISFSYPTYPETKFGLELGAVLRDLNFSDPFNEEELFWGIIRGFCGWPDGFYETEQINIEELISELDTKRKNREESVKKSLEANEAYGSHMESVNNKIIKILNDNGVKVDHVPATVYAKMRYKEGGGEVPEDFVDNIDTEQLKWNIKLKEIVEKDGNKMENESWRGEKAESIINELWLQYKTKNNNTIQFEDMNTPRNKNTAMKLINQYSSVDKHKNVSEYPIIEQTNTGYRLTVYGQLISYCFFENNGDCEWIEGYNISTNQRSRGDVELSDRQLSIMQNAVAEIDINVE